MTLEKNIADGTEIVATYKGDTHEAVIVRNGNKVGCTFTEGSLKGQTFDSLAQARRAIDGWWNGWKFFGVKGEVVQRRERRVAERQARASADITPEKVAAKADARAKEMLALAGKMPRPTAGNGEVAHIAKVRADESLTNVEKAHAIGGHEYERLNVCAQCDGPLNIGGEYHQRGFTEGTVCCRCAGH